MSAARRRNYMRRDFKLEDVSYDLQAAKRKEIEHAGIILQYNGQYPTPQLKHW